MSPISAITVVVPTRDERDNICPLIRRLETACADLSCSVLFVDDSRDDTPAVIDAEAPSCTLPITVVHRPESERVGGLGGAVCAGLTRATSEWACVMDADLQHPPELIGALAAEAQRSGADVVVASRYLDCGGVGDFTLVRRALSRGSALAALALFPRRLRGVSDPMSGFFLVRRTAIDVEALRPRGFKILLEILLCSRRLAASEIPFTFGTRLAGKSKASPREAARYLLTLIELRLGRRPAPRAMHIDPRISRPKPARHELVGAGGAVGRDRHSGVTS